MSKRVKAILISVFCTVVCAAIVVGVILYQRTQEQKEVDLACEAALETYLRMQNLSELVVTDLFISEQIPFDDTFINNYEGLQYYCGQMDTELRGVLEITDFESKYPHAVRWFFEFFEYVAENDFADIDREHINKCDTLLHAGGSSSFEHNLKRIEEDIATSEYF